MFHPMAFTVVIALTAAMVLSLTFVPAAVAAVPDGPQAETRKPRRAHAVAAGPSMRRVLRPGAAIPRSAVVAARRSCSFDARRLLASPHGDRVHPQPGRGRHRPARAAHPRHQPDPGGRMQDDARSADQAVPGGRARVRQAGHRRSRDRPDAAVVADTFIMLKPREQWPDPRKTQGEQLVQRDRGRGAAAARQQLRVHPAHPDAHQRADLGRARGCRDQAVRRRPRAAGRSRRADREAVPNSIARRGGRQAGTGRPACRC